MTEKDKHLLYFLGGFFLGSMIFLGVAFWSAQEAARKVGAVWEKAYANLQIELLSTATILAEPTPLKGLTFFGGGLELRPGPQFKGPRQFRWYIPAKVKPIAYDAEDARSLVYYHWDPKTEKLQGPFRPRVTE